MRKSGWSFLHSLKHNLLTDKQKTDLLFQKEKTCIRKSGSIHMATLGYYRCKKDYWIVEEIWKKF